MTELQTPEEFFIDLVSQIKTAKKRIHIQTMNFEVGERMSVLEPLLIDAVKRGVYIEIYCDWVAQRFIHGDLPLLPTFLNPQKKYIYRIHNENLVLRERLKQAGVLLHTTNIPSVFTSWFPAFGRDHKKIYIVDDQAWIGGVNLFDEAFTNIDIMVKFINQKVVDSLLKIYNTKKENYTVALTDNYTMYLDTGSIGKSIIYDTIHDSIKHAKEQIIFVSQFVPDGKLLNKLVEAADNGVDVIIITSFRQDRKFTKYPEKVSYQLFIRRIKDIPKITFLHLKNRVHAKLVVIDKSTAFWGSHNFTYTGVLLGTEEIMMESNDSKLLEQINTFTNKIIHS